MIQKLKKLIKNDRDTQQLSLKNLSITHRYKPGRLINNIKVLFKFADTLNKN